MRCAILYFITHIMDITFNKIAFSLLNGLLVFFYIYIYIYIYTEEIFWNNKARDIHPTTKYSQFIYILFWSTGEYQFIIVIWWIQFQNFRKKYFSLVLIWCRFLTFLYFYKISSWIKIMMGVSFKKNLKYIFLPENYIYLKLCPFITLIGNFMPKFEETFWWWKLKI